MGSADRPIWRKACAVFSASSSLISETRTVMPSRASRSAMAAPIPMAAPVTSATFESVFADIVLWLLYLMQGKKSPLKTAMISPSGLSALAELCRQIRRITGKSEAKHLSPMKAIRVEARLSGCHAVRHRGPTHRERGRSDALPAPPRLDIRVALLLAGTARVRYGPTHRRANLLGIL